jgi:hypothetical protein
MFLSPAAITLADTTTSDSTDALQAENRNDSSLAIAENIQGTYLLRQLLLGRKFQFFGHIEGDVAFYRVPSFSDQDGAELRRFRVGIAGLNPWFKNLSYKLEFDLAAGSPSAIGTASLCGLSSREKMGPWSWPIGCPGLI